MEKREIFSLRKDVFAEDGRCFPLVYKLMESQELPADPRYGIRCYIEGMDLDRHAHDLAEVDLPCGSGEQALSVMERLAARGVMPIHIAEVLDEFLS